MSHAIAQAHGFATHWTALNGPMKGSVRILNQPTFAIGRSPDCEVPIPTDPKCSRRHAIVEWTNNGCVIVSLNEKNLVMVNGTEVSRTRLADGDIVTVGETELRFRLGAPAPAKIGAEPMAPAHFGQPGPSPAPAHHQKRTRHSTQDRGSKRFLIYAVVGSFLVWVFWPSNKNKDEVKIRTEQQVQADIGTAAKLKEVAENAAIKRVDNTISARQAQENYVRGFRDYRDGQYERSLVSFQACLALNPEHTLCNRYLRLSQRKFNELVQYHMVLGRKYRAQNQYKACRAAFRNVMVMVKDANSALYKEAKANYEACHSFVEGRF